MTSMLALTLSRTLYVRLCVGLDPLMPLSAGLDPLMLAFVLEVA